MTNDIKISPTPEQRKEAERVYSLEAFDFAANPIGSRDWALFWHVYQAALEAATVCDHVWQAKASNGAHGPSNAECAKCGYVPNLAPPVHVTPDPEAKGDIAAWLRRRAHGDLVMIPGRLAGEIADHIDALTQKPVEGPFTMDDSVDGQCFKDINRPGHGGFMRIVWRTEDDALSNKRNPECERIANFVLDAINRAADHIPQSTVVDDPLGYVSADQLQSWPHTGGSISLWKHSFNQYTVPVFQSIAPSKPVEGIAADVVEEFMSANSALQSANERGTWTSNYKHPLPFRLDAERRYRAAREALLQAIKQAGSKVAVLKRTTP